MFRRSDKKYILIGYVQAIVEIYRNLSSHVQAVVEADFEGKLRVNPEGLQVAASILTISRGSNPGMPLGSD